ncbi:hypothetical protein ASPZODRAFT_2122587 [Penicilliopsis zonata CBS 506.65]|uniref:FAD-binding FR-type domain-containing protein n=1 Tax=Penicilliopsis zonata CBS 506.65 TaxID=1073090 RepID=A0A1L9S537_9EURO|nr:hypothetical protein ASPZODRAFT_2122587 [Penicilliopsis zonata CBS 506.65]OJJ42263.1 hypothetical protein ASPZODRAFT_2122587 [Penicilliopsis zonata CBS 506.65]
MDNNTTYEYSRGLDGVNMSRDILFSRTVMACFIFLGLSFLAVRSAQSTHAYLRQAIASASPPQAQAFWGLESSRLRARLKRHLLYAPLGVRRHSRELRGVAGAHLGTLPSRLQAAILLLYLASQVVYCAWLDYAANPRAALVAEIRGRAGTLAVLNMVPLFILAGRNNPLIPLLAISFNSYNLLHRWLGRIVVFEAAVHTAAWMVNATDEQGFTEMLQRLHRTPFFQWGCLAAAAFSILFMTSLSPLRHAFYETFLHLHLLAVAAAVLGIAMHLHLDALPQQPWIRAAAILWVAERSLRLFRLFYLNYSVTSGQRTVLTVQALPFEACKVTVRLPRRIHLPPGCHIYLYLPALSWWMSHPFSVAWVQPGKSNQDDIELGHAATPEEVSCSIDATDKSTTTLVLVIAARAGMTRKLYDRARACPDRLWHPSGLLEGPYATNPGACSMGSYGAVVLFAGGSGITHHLLPARDLLLRASGAQVATRRICLVWCLRCDAQLAWAHDLLKALLLFPAAQDILTIKLYISSQTTEEELASNSILSSLASSVQVFSGRCQPGRILDEVLADPVGATLVSVCGPGCLADEIRSACRNRLASSVVIDLVEAAFTW